MSFEADGYLVTDTQSSDSEAVELTFTGTIATDTQVDVTVYQDESGGTTADNQEQLTDVQHGNTYSLSNFTASSGATYWTRFDLTTSNTDNTPEVDEASVAVALVVSVPTTSTTVQPQTPTATEVRIIPVPTASTATATPTPTASGAGTATITATRGELTLVDIAGDITIIEPPRVGIYANQTDSKIRWQRRDEQV